MEHHRGHSEMEKCIAQILSREVITQQHTVLTRLKQEGMRASQATLSRCLHRMGVAKVQGVYQLSRRRQIVLESVLCLKQVPPNLLLLHTPPGHANSVAAYLDPSVRVV